MAGAGVAASSLASSGSVTYGTSYNGQTISLKSYTGQVTITGSHITVKDCKLTNGGANSDPNAVYFDAGINGQMDGLFGEITLTPEPATYGTVALGLAMLFGLSRFKGRRARPQA